MKRRNVRTLSLIVVTFTYLLIGAAVFDALEGDHNEKSGQGLQKIQNDFKLKYNMTESDYKILELIIIEKEPHKSGPQWKFVGSFYYALVVLTLIGYGHSTPKTTLGKGFTMVYAMLGIPMAMIMFQSMGERMNKLFGIIIKKSRQLRGFSHVEVTESDLILASGIMSSIVIAFGAVLYHTQEGWSFFDSLYYCFVSLSTIGFGDYVALQNESSLELHPGYVVCSFVFLLLGLASLSSSINLLVLRFMILSLEEDEEEIYDLQDVTQNVITLDEDINGPALSRRFALRQPETVSVCSCTCIPTSKKVNKNRKRKKDEGGYSSKWKRLRNLFSKWQRNLSSEEDDTHYYDAETMSISNSKKFAIKRNSM